MKRILSFNEYSLSLTLTESELENYFYIIESLNENVNEGLVDRLKEVVSKGVLTTAMFSMLMSNPSFAKEYNSLPQSEKTAIENTVSKNGKGIQYLNVGDNFGSGEYNLSNKQKLDIKAQLKDLLDKAEKSKTYFILTVESSESNVPNKDISTKKYLDKGEISKRRAAAVQEILREFVKENEKTYSSLFVINPVNTNPVEDSEKAGWDKKAVAKMTKSEVLALVNNEKYTKHQFVRIAVERGEESAQTPCNMDKEVEGEEAKADVNYISLRTLPVFPVKNSYGSGGVILNSGEIPDRIVLVADNENDPKKNPLEVGKVIGDSGYKASWEHRTLTDWKYIPAHILKLTKLRNEKSSATMDTKFFKAIIKKKGVDFTTFESLVELMLKNKSYDYKNKRGSDEVGSLSTGKGPLQELKNMYDNGQEEFMFYEVNGGSEQSPNNSVLEYTLDGSYSSITVIVYSPLGRTHYKMYGLCGVNNDPKAVKVVF
jgi:hypothetical protein